MIGTEFIKGQGLGNQLLVLVTAKALAKKYGYEFGTASQEKFAMNIHNDKGMYFMDVDLGYNITPEEKEKMKHYDEKEVRLYLGTGVHDMTHGCYVAGVDDYLLNDLEDNTLIYGNLQAGAYFDEYKDEFKEWLKVKPEFDSYEYSQDDLCIINVRGGEYAGAPYLFLDRKYFLNAMKKMRQINPNMRFMVVTDDEHSAKRVLPEIEAHHFDMGKDYVTVKNAKYLILSNSSFALLPAYTNEVAKYIIAPKYWARHNVSDGYWASEQNIYDLFNYMDRKGRIFTADECRVELEEYKKNSKRYKKDIVNSTGIKRFIQNIQRRLLLVPFWTKRIFVSVWKRVVLR